jgi:hypothetical protein
MAKQQWGYKTRKFDGKPYRIGTWHVVKSAAQARAKVLRGKGYKVRIVKQDGQHVIYARPDPFKQ